MMRRYRSVLALVLGVVLTFFMSVASPAFAATKTATTYTPAQLEQIQRYEGNLLQFRGRMQELATLIQNRRWIDVRSFIHGPFGELGPNANRLTRTLLPTVRPEAQLAAKGVLGHLVEIDEAAQNEDYRQAIRNYAEAIKDFDALLSLVPQG